MWATSALLIASETGACNRERNSGARDKKTSADARVTFKCSAFVGTAKGGLWAYGPITPPPNPPTHSSCPFITPYFTNILSRASPHFCVRRNPAKMKSTNVRKGSAAKDLAQQHVETEGCVGLQLLTSAWLSLPPLSTNAQHARARIPRGASVTRILLLSAPLLSASPTPLGLTAPNVFIPTAISAPEINRECCQFSKEKDFKAASLSPRSCLPHYFLLSECKK